MDNVRNAVDDLKTAIKSLGDSNEAESSVQDNGHVKSVPEPCPANKEKQSEKDDKTSMEEKRIIVNNSVEQKKSNVSEQSLQFPQDYPDDCHQQPSRYELLSNIDMYTIASQTQDFIGGLLGAIL